MTIVTTMCKLLFAMAIGFILYKMNILTSDANKKMSALIVNVTCPCLIIYSVSDVSHDDPQLVLKLFAAGVIIYLLLPLFSWVVVRLMRVPEELRGTYMCMFMFSNNQFMGFPVVQALYGESAIFYATIFNMPFNIILFSLGLNLLHKDASVTTGEYKKEKFNPKNLINMGIISAVAAMIIYFANLKLPDLFYECLSFVGNITTPLSMIIIGSSLAAASLKEIKSEKGVWPMLPVRLAVIPFLTWCFMHLFTTDPTIIGVATVTLGMPIASMVAMSAVQYERQSKCASIGVAVSTICSMVTIPIMSILLGVG